MRISFCSKLLIFYRHLKVLLLLHAFNGLFLNTTWVSQHQKSKPFWILLEQEMIGWQWHQLDHMHIICTSLQTDDDASTSSLSFFIGQMPFLPPNQQRQSTEGTQTPQGKSLKTVENWWRCIIVAPSSGAEKLNTRLKLQTFPYSMPSKLS